MTARNMSCPYYYIPLPRQERDTTREGRTCVGASEECGRKRKQCGLSPRWRFFHPTQLDDSNKFTCTGYCTVPYKYSTCTVRWSAHGRRSTWCLRFSSFHRSRVLSLSFHYHTRVFYFYQTTPNRISNLLVKRFRWRRIADKLRSMFEDSRSLVEWNRIKSLVSIPHHQSSS